MLKPSQLDYILNSLVGVNAIHLCIEEQDDSKISHWHGVTRMGNSLDILFDNWFVHSGLGQLWRRFMPSLNKVTVIVNDRRSFFEDFDRLSSRSSVLEKTWYAEKIRSSLLEKEAAAHIRECIADRKDNQKQRRKQRREELKVLRLETQRETKGREQVYASQQKGRIWVPGLTLEQAGALVEKVSFPLQ